MSKILLLCVLLFSCFFTLTVTADPAKGPVMLASKVIGLDADYDGAITANDIKEGKEPFLVRKATALDLFNPFTENDLIMAANGEYYIPIESISELVSLESEKDNKLTMTEKREANIEVASFTPNGEVKVLTLDKTNFGEIQADLKRETIVVERLDGQRPCSGHLVFLSPTI